MVVAMLTLDQMFAPTLRRRAVTIRGLRGTPTLTFDAANSSNPRWLEWVLGREENGALASPPDDAPKLEGVAALREVRQQALEMVAMVNEACLVAIEADDGEGSRIAYPLEVGRQLVQRLATTEQAAFLALFQALQKDDGGDAAIGVDVEAIAGEASGG